MSQFLQAEYLAWKPPPAHRPNAVMVGIGASSLHPTWIRDADRNFDIITVNYTGAELPLNGADFQFIGEGKKWQLMGSLLQNDAVLEAYDFIGLFDDDLELLRGSLSDGFDIGKRLAFELFQPAIDPGVGYGTAWPHLLAQENSDLRYTNMIEIMAPILSRRMAFASRDVMPLTEMGWGIDTCIWPSLLNEWGFTDRSAVLDRVVLAHQRPQGRNYSNARAAVDMQLMLKRLRLAESAHYRHILDYTHPSLEVSDAIRLPAGDSSAR